MAANFNTAIDVNPSTGFNEQVKVRVNTAKFGDGYSQRTSSGLNSKDREFSLSFNNQSLEKSAQIIAFLETAGTGDPQYGGVEYFLWTPPDKQESIKVICSEWDEEYSSPFTRTIKAKFVRVYDI